MGEYTNTKVPITTLDSYNLPRIDLLKIDVEGYEIHVLKGAEETLLRCKPVVIFEEKNDIYEPRMFIESLGFIFQEKVGSECIYSM